jgi:hypothetical protein
MWGCEVSANEFSCAHGAQINFGDPTPYLTYGLKSHHLFCKSIGLQKVCAVEKYPPCVIEFILDGAESK